MSTPNPATIPLDPDALPASRALDALVAEKVMGWEWFRFIRHEDSYIGEFGPAQGDEPIAENYGEHPPLYSTSIAAAWEVVEKLRDTQFTLERDALVSAGGWSCMMGGFGEGSTAPLAICRAALKAVGVTDEAKV